MRHQYLVIAWLLSDSILFVSMYILAYFLRVGWILSTDFPFERFITITIFIAPLWLLVLTTTRTFAITRNQATIRNAAYIAYAAVVGVALFTLAYYFRYEAFFSRLLLVIAFFFTFTGIWGWHVLFERIMRSLLCAASVFPTLIIGLSRESKNLIATLQKTKNPLKPVAILDARGSKENAVHGVHVLGKLNRLEDVLQEKKITHLIQCADLEQSLNLLSACRKTGITYMLLPSVLGIAERDERIDSIEGHPVTVVSPKGPWWEWFFR